LILLIPVVGLFLAMVSMLSSSLVLAPTQAEHQGMTFRPAFAAALWYLPIANIYLSFQLIRQILVDSSTEVRKKTRNRLFWFWACQVLCIAFFIYGFSFELNSWIGSRWATMFWAFGWVVQAAAILIGIYVPKPRLEEFNIYFTMATPNRSEAFESNTVVTRKPRSTSAGKYCRNCGAEVISGATYCRNCGTPIGSSPR
jgi:hypothetical protein